MLNGSWRDLTLRFGTFLAFCLVVVVFVVAIPKFATLQNCENMIKQTAVLLLVSFGLLLPMIAGEIDLSFGGTIGLAGAFFAGLSGTESPIVAAVVALLICTGFGFLNGIFIAYFGLSSFLVTLSTMFIGMGAERLYTHGFNIWVEDLELLKIFNGYVLGVPNTLILIVVVSVSLWFWCTHTRRGHHTRAVGENVIAAREAGIPVERVKVLAFSLAGAFYGLCAIFNVLRVSGLLAYAGMNLLLPAMAACFIGATMFLPSKKNVPGTFVGAFFLTLITNGFSIFGADYYFIPFTQGLLLIAAVILANAGLKGLKIQQVKF